MSYRTYSPCNGAIINARGNGDFSDLPTAMATAGAAWNTIYYVNEAGSTYTGQDFTMPPGVLLTSMPGSGINGNIQVNTQITINQAGNYTISNLELVSSTKNSLVISGSGAVNVVIDSCFLNCTGFTGINFSNSNSSSTLTLINCTLDIGNSSVTYYTMSSPGNLNILFCDCNNSSSSSVASNNSAGTVTINNSGSNAAFSSSGSGQISANGANINTQAAGLNLTGITANGSGNGSIVNCSIQSGSASCIIIGSSTTLGISNNSLSTTNANAIGGSGRVNLTDYHATSGISCPITKNLTGTFVCANLYEFGLMTIAAGATIDVQSGAKLQIDPGGVVDFPLTGVIYGSGAGNAITAIADGTVGQVLTANPSGPPTFQTSVPAPLVAGFNYYYTTNASDVTGDGTAYTITPDGINFNTGMYNSATGVITFPLTGVYSFNLCLILVGIAAGHTLIAVQVYDGTYYQTLEFSNPYPTSASGLNSYNYTYQAEFEQGATIQFVLTVFNSTKVIGIQGESTPYFYTYLSGVYLFST